MNKQIQVQRKQLGMTLMEVLASLAIIATVVVGSLSLFGAANSSSTASQLQKDLIALRTATQTQYTGQGSYGAVSTSLNPILVKSRKVPTSLNTTSSNTITTSLNGTVAVSVHDTNVNQFTITVTAVPDDVCASLVTSMSSGWASVQVGSATARTTFPVSPTDATTDCTGNNNSIVWTTQS